MPGRTHPQPEQGCAPHPPAAAAAREPLEDVVLEDIAVEHQRDAQGDDRQGDPVKPQGGQAHDKPEREGSQHAHGDLHPVVDVKSREHHPGGICSNPAKRLMAERRLADVAGQQDEAEQPESPDDGQRRVELETYVEADRQPGQNSKCDEGQPERDNQTSGHCAATLNPRGLRTISTARITTSATRRGKPIDWIQIVGYVSSRPSANPPATVSGNEVMPPIRAAASASMIRSVRLVVSKLMKGVIRIPATAAITLPSIQLTAPTSPTRTPHTDAELSLSDTARIERPKLV